MSLYEQYLKVDEDGTESLDYQALYRDLAEIRGFNAASEQRQKYDRVKSWFDQRVFMKENPNEVPF